MKITELLNESSILLDINAVTKEAVWEQLADTFHAANVITDKTAYLQAVAKREELGTTGVGFGVAIPHAKSGAVAKPAIGFARINEGIDVASLDETKADLFFLIAAPQAGDDIHLQALSRLARMLMHESFLAELRSAQNKADIFAAIRSREA
ncbi:MAG: fructose PTS transporter subunit IIA [Sporomusaceae bacterium]|nr:fructose PTS transporter subunit IIA [Sporomusaceae bacterium]